MRKMRNRALVSNASYSLRQSAARDGLRRGAMESFLKIQACHRAGVFLILFCL